MKLLFCNTSQLNPRLPAPCTLLNRLTTTPTPQKDLSMNMEDDDILDLVPAGILRDFRDTVKIKNYH